MPKRNVMEEFSLHEISAVDRPAQVPARVAILKRDDADTSVAGAIAKVWTDPANGAVGFASVLEESMDSRRYCEVMEAAGPTINALDTTLRSIVADKNYPSTQKQTLLRNAVEEFMAAVRVRWPDIEQALNKAFTPDGDADTQGESEMEKAARTELEKKLKALTDDIGKLDKSKDAAKVLELTEKAAAMKAELDADTQKSLQAEADALKAANADLEIISKMTDAEKAYHAELKDEDEKKKFRAASAEDRKKVMTAKAASDETVVVAGHTVRKSAVGADTFAIMKAQAEEIEKNKADIAKERELRVNSELTKRADTELAHFGGTVVEKVDVLKAIDTMPEAAKKSLTEMLKAGEKAIAAGFELIGNRGGDAPVRKREEKGETAKGKFETAVDKTAAEYKLTKTQAMSKVRKDQPDLYKAMQDEAAEIQGVSAN